MLDRLGRNWWALVIRGIVAVAFGLAAFFQPNLTLSLLIVLFGAFALVDGASLLIAFFRGESDKRGNGLPVALMGGVGVVSGIVAFFWPGITAISLLYLVAFWLILTGILQVIAAIGAGQSILDELGLALGGVLAVAVGAYLVANPGAGLVSLAWLVGLFAIAFGALNLVIAWRTRKVHRAVDQVRRSSAA